MRYEIVTLPDARGRGRLGAELPRWLVPVAAFAAIRVATWVQGDPVGRAEGTFLALLAAGVLATIAALDAAIETRRGGAELGLTALLAAAAAALAYQGPPRGAAVTLVLLAGFAAAAGRFWLDPAGRLRPAGALTPAVSMPLAFGLQLFLRPDLLLAPLLDPRTLVSLLLLPATAAVAASILATRFGAGRTMLAGGVAAVLAPGWTVTSTLALLALAAGSLAVSRDPLVRRGARAFLVLLALWDPPLGVVFALAGATLAVAPAANETSIGEAFATPETRRPQALAAIGFALVLVTVLAPPVHVPLEATTLFFGAALLVPAALLAKPGDRALAGLGLGAVLAAALVAPMAEAMAAGVALAALAVPAGGSATTRSPRAPTPPAGPPRAPTPPGLEPPALAPSTATPPAAVTLQRLWCAAVVAGVALLRAYPWVRAEPRRELLELLGLGSEPVAFAVLALVVVGGGLAIDRLRRRRRWPRWRLAPRPAILGAILLGGALLRLPTPTAALVNSYEPVTVDGGMPRWLRPVEPPRPLATVVVDTSLAAGATLAPGTPIARVMLRDAERRSFETWHLVAGRDTAEWAAARPDVDALPDFEAPPPWISTVAPDGSFFARRYRTRLHVPAAAGTASFVDVVRDPDLPPEVALTIFRLELRG